MHASLLFSKMKKWKQFLSNFIIFFICGKVLLWQTSVATGPHIFIIATCIWSVKIIYLLVKCNKQSVWSPVGPRHLCSLYTFYVFSYLHVFIVGEGEETYLLEFIRKILNYELSILGHLEDREVLTENFDLILLNQCTFEDQPK